MEQQEEKGGERSFMDKYALLVLIIGIVAVMVILKVIGFPEILNK